MTCTIYTNLEIVKRDGKAPYKVLYYTNGFDLVRTSHHKTEAGAVAQAKAFLVPHVNMVLEAAR